MGDTLYWPISWHLSGDLATEWQRHVCSDYLCKMQKTENTVAREAWSKIHTYLTMNLLAVSHSDKGKGSAFDKRQRHGIGTSEYLLEQENFSCSKRYLEEQVHGERYELSKCQARLQLSLHQSWYFKRPSKSKISPSRCMHCDLKIQKGNVIHLDWRCSWYRKTPLCGQCIVEEGLDADAKHHTCNERHCRHSPWA